MTGPSFAVAVAKPPAPVLFVVVGFTDPPPLNTSKVTGMPLTGFPNVSVTLTTKGFTSWVAMRPVWLFPLTNISRLAAPAFTVILAVPEVRPVLEAFSAYVPTTVELKLDVATP